MDSQYLSGLNNIYDYIKSLKFLNECGLIKMIKQNLKENPYEYNNVNNSNNFKSDMWKEQALINFPLLYLASVYLYIYAKEKGCTTFLFTTRDCCHWHRIFSKLFPHCNVHYFHCSRNMFEKATFKGNTYFDNYVKSLVKSNMDKVIFVDVHGTCKRMFSYFSQRLGHVPHGFLLSSTYKTYSKFPQVTKYYKNKNKFINLVFNARGSPCESLNYDAMGTLQDFNEKGPVRDKLEYDVRLIEPYHECINAFLKNIYPLNKELDHIDNKHLLEKLETNINNIYKIILQKKPMVLKYIEHIGKHKKKKGTDLNLDNFNFNELNIYNQNNQNNQNDQNDQNYNQNYNHNHNHNKNKNKNQIDFKKIDFKKINFNEILSDDTIYSLIWKGSYNNNRCAIKMLMLRSGIYYDKDSNKYYDGNKNTEIDTRTGDKYFEDSDVPFVHSQFKTHKAMHVAEFNNEINQLSYLSNYNMSPKFYGYCIINKHGIDYGFIVMERMDCSVKQILLKRSLTNEEEYIIKKTIDSLHNDYQMVHGDLKPSNIGVYLNQYGLIEKCAFFDCQKVKNGKNYNKHDFKKLVNKDWNKYHMHLEKNIKDRNH